MKIYSFSQQGKRSNNEDYTGYNERLWMVCDGVGGHVSGERASKFVVETMLEYFQQDVPELNKNRIQEYIVKVQAELNAILDTEPELEKMGTTFTGIFKTDAFWYAAHLGDSRIHLYRSKEKKMWHTWDHSLVGELMKNKEITLEDGRHHPLSNRIHKAMIANFEGKTNTPDIVKIDNLQPGDLFMLCSDGVIEAWSDLELVNLFSDERLSFEEKCQKLQEQCDQLSKDNNTALILEIEDADAFSYGQNEELRWTSFDEIQEDFQEYLNKQREAEGEDDLPDIEDVEVEGTNNSEHQEDIPLMESAIGTLTDAPKDNKKRRLILIVIAATLLILGAVAGIMLERAISNEKSARNKATVTSIKCTKQSKSKNSNDRNLKHKQSKKHINSPKKKDSAKTTSEKIQKKDDKKKYDEQRKSDVKKKVNELKKTTQNKD